MGQSGSVWKRKELNLKCDPNLNALEFQGTAHLCAWTFTIILCSGMLQHIFYGDYSLKVGVKIRYKEKWRDVAK